MKERQLPQLALQIGSPPAVEDVSDAVLLGKADLLSALRLCMDVSGLQDDHISSVLGMQAAQFSKCRAGTGHFPPNKIMALMDVCKNDIPLRWMALHRGKELKPLFTTLEREVIDLRAALAARDRDLEVIRQFVRATSK